MAEQLPSLSPRQQASTSPPVNSIRPGSATSRQARMKRSYDPPAACPADPNIRPLLDSAKRHAEGPYVVNPALASLAELTAWQAQNQQAIVDTNGLSTLFALLKQASARPESGSGSGHPRTQQDPETTRLVLWVLMNLAANDAISARISAEPGVMKSLVALLDNHDASARQRSVFAARCLINLTCSNAAAQQSAFKVGALNAASQLLLRDTDEGACKVYTWLLCNLTASHLSPARSAIAAAPELLHRILGLLDCPTPSAAPCAMLAARTLGNVARGGPDCQATLIQAGAVRKLLACLCGPADKDLQLSAALLEALSTLAVDQPDAAAALLSSPQLLPRLEAIVRQDAKQQTRARCWTKEVTAASPNEGHLLLAAHVLVHVLAYSKADARPAQGKPEPHAGGSGVPPALYMKLEEAAGLLRIQMVRPAAPPSPEAGAGGGREADSTLLRPPAFDSDEEGLDASPDVLQLLPAVELAELLHTIHDVLLPRMREPNVGAACDAVARLYHLAAGQGGKPGCKHAATCLQLMAEASLVEQLVVLMRERDAQLSTACLCLLDCMSSSARCRVLLAGTDWLDHVQALLESPDRVVRLLARRALCSVHAQEHEQGESA